MEIGDNSLLKLHQMRLKGEVSTVEICNYYSKRIEQYDGVLHSYLDVFAKDALAKAEAADELIAKKEELSFVCGMPLAIKDIFSMAGTRTTCGSKILKDYVAPFDSTVVKLLKQAGAAILGKTNLDEFAMGSSTENSAFGLTKNPWNLAHVPGGSSGGSAAAVAAKLCTAALGTDTGGSVRQPAGFCGIVGLKPTYGSVSRYGMVPYGSSLDQAGVLASDVADAASIFDLLAQHDPLDYTSVKRPKAKPLSAAAGEGVKGMRIATISDLDLSGCSDDVVHNFNQTLDLLKSAGAVITEVSIPAIKYAISTYYIIAMAEASSNLGRYDGIRYGMRVESENLLDLYQESRSTGFGAEVKLRILMGTFVLSAGYYDAYYGRAVQVQAMLRQQFKAAFQNFDALATPIAPTVAFKIGETTTDKLKTYLLDAFTVPANLTGIPGIAVPAGFSADNLPIGIQFLADHFQESKLIRLGAAIEQGRPSFSNKLAL